MVLPDGAIVVSVGPSVPVETSNAQVTGESEAVSVKSESK